jgi:hypothetical protein
MLARFQIRSVTSMVVLRPAELPSAVRLPPDASVVRASHKTSPPVVLGHLIGGRSSPHVQLVQPFVFLLLVADVVSNCDLIAADR